MTDKDIIKALEYCERCECNDEKTETECPLINMSFCRNYLRKQSLDLINRQKAEIERLEIELKAMRGAANSYKAEFEKLQVRLRKERHQFDDVAKTYSIIKTEAIKEFAKRLKANLNNVARVRIDDYDYFCVGLGFIDNLVKEMAGDSQ